MRLVVLFLCVSVVALGAVFYSHYAYSSANLEEVRQRVMPQLEAALEGKALTFGAPIYMRIFKQSRELEVWLQKDARFILFKTYPICHYSGDLGPKLKEGDHQAPEGFYAVGKSALNPKSSYHLSFNLGYPNKYDRAHQRSGSFLMVHGSCVSIGCYAMTDPAIEEIYLLSEGALNAGQPYFRVHIFPFRMTDANMERHQRAAWYAFWRNLKEGYDAFSASHIPPNVIVKNKRYVFESY